jgi:hypothetical protein
MLAEVCRWREGEIEHFIVRDKGLSGRVEFSETARAYSSAFGGVCLMALIVL